MTYAQPQADPTSVVGRRIGAYAVDVLLAIVVMGAILVPQFLDKLETVPSGTFDCGTSSSTFDEPNSDRPSFCFEDGDEIRYLPKSEEGSFGAQFYGLLFGVQIVNLVLLQGLTGASVGKLLVGLRVVREDGRRAGMGWAALRFLVLQVDQLCCFLPGAILVFATKGHRRLGDMAASTFVVRSSQVGTAPYVPGVTSGYGTPGYSAAPGGPGAWPAGPTTGASWGAPPTGQTGTWAPGAAAAPAAPTGEGPTWDAARNAYIQYDGDQGSWVQWNDATKAWGPIDQ